MSDLTYREAAEYLNVSPATIKNWIRQGVLPSRPPLHIDRADLSSFKRNLGRGSSERLTKRANKSSSRSCFIPEEYVEADISRKKLIAIAGELQALKENPSRLLFAYFLNKLRDLGITGDKPTHHSALPLIRHRGIAVEMKSWHSRLGVPDLGDLADRLGRMGIPEQLDTAGLLYQMLQKEGRKSARGSYYTPEKLAGEILDYYGGQWKEFLDPCCGSGIFLLLAARKSDRPESVEGWDSDRTAVHIARMNLMLAFPRRDFEPRVYHRNALTGRAKYKFDLIATNPPWGHHFSNRELKAVRRRFPCLQSGESFSCFIAAGLELLSPGGTLSCFLPEALLKVKTHRDIREMILDKSRITTVKYLGKCFRKVQTEVIRMDLRPGERGGYTTVCRENRIYRVGTERFRKSPQLIFDFNCTERDLRILDALNDLPHVTLENRALWILGIVTGNNNRFISTEPLPGRLPIISGRDIKPFSLSPPQRFIEYDRDRLQQSASPEMYGLKPKLIYRFITGRPVFAIDRTGYLTLNSANSLFPEKGISPEFLAALFNSSLYRFILRKQFNSIKVLRNHLEQLPIPLNCHRERILLESLVIEAENAAPHRRDSLARSIDIGVFNLFKINHSDRKYILEKLE